MRTRHLSHTCGSPGHYKQPPRHFPRTPFHLPSEPRFSNYFRIMADDLSVLWVDKASAYILLSLLLLVLCLCFFSLAPTLPSGHSFLDDYLDLISTSISLVKRSDPSKLPFERAALLRSLAQAQSHIQESRASLAWLRTFPSRHRFTLWLYFRPTIYQQTHAAFLTIQPYLKDIPCLSPSINNNLISIRDALSIIQEKLPVDTGSVADEVFMLRDSINKFSDWVMVEVQRTHVQRISPTQSCRVAREGSDTETASITNESTMDRQDEVR